MRYVPDAGARCQHSDACGLGQKDPAAPGTISEYGSVSRATYRLSRANDNLLHVVPARGGNLQLALATLHELRESMSPVPLEVYERFEADARERLVRRDPDDWPILAAALALECAIWTEDRYFFGVGAATWTSDRVEIYLRSPTPPAVR